MASQQFYNPKKSGDSNDVYDDEGFTPPSADPLASSRPAQSQRVIDDADNTLDNIDAVLADQERPGLYNPDRDTDANSDSRAESGERLSSKEETAGEGSKDSESAGAGGAASGAMAAASGPAGALLAGLKKVAGSKKAKGGAVIGGALGIGLGSVLISGFLGLQTMKVQGMTNNWRTIFMSNSMDAADRMSANLMRHYIMRAVIPGMVKNSCSSTLAGKSCADVSDSDNIVSALFRAWRDNNLEGKWAERGFEIQRVGNRYFIRSSSLNERLDLGTYDAGNTKAFEGRLFAELSRSDVRRQMATLYENETAARRLHVLAGTAKLAERKYGIRRCVIACKTQDRLEDTKYKAKAHTIIWAERILIPRSSMYSLVLECSLASFNCADIPAEADQNGERLSKFEIDLRSRLQQHRATYGTRSLEEVDAEAEKINKYGIAGYTLRASVGDSEVVDKALGKIVPVTGVIGWIDFGARLVAGAEKAGPALKTMNRVMQTTSAAAVASYFYTVGDEGKTGNIDPEMMASAAAAFDENPANDQGGGAAEAHPAFDSVNNRGGVYTASIINAFMPKALAAETRTVTAHTCYEGGSSAQGSKFCAEETVGVLSSIGKILENVSKAFNNPIGFLPSFAANLYLSTLGKLVDFINAVTGALNPINLEQIVGWMATKVMPLLVVNGFTEKMSGGRTWAMGTVGSAEIGNYDAHYGLGGRVLSPSETATIMQRQLDDRQAAFESRPLYARLFDTNEAQSLISQTAMSLPSGSGRLAQTVSSFANPFTTFSTTLGSVFSTKQVRADASLHQDIGIKPVGYGSDDSRDPVMTADPEKYWEERNCVDPNNKKAWGEKAYIDPETGMPEHRETNGCMLLRRGISNGGGNFDRKLLELEEAAGGSNSGAASGGGGSTGGAIIGDPYTDSTSVPCDSRTKDLGIADGYVKMKLFKVRLCSLPNLRSFGPADNPGNDFTTPGADGHAIVNSRVSGAWFSLVEAAKSDGVTLSAGSSFRSMRHQESIFAGNPNPKFVARPGGSSHQAGVAIDFSNMQVKGGGTCASRATSGNPGWKWLYANAEKYGFKQYSAEAWHWDALPEANRCDSSS